MPASRKQASFEPIPPDLNLRQLVEDHEHFSFVDRISVDRIEEQGLDKFEKLVLLHVILGGKPLVIDGFKERLEPWLFSEKWLRDNCGSKAETARDITNKRPLPLTIGHYLNHLQKLANQFWEGPLSYKDKNRQRVYLKDIDCPKVWEDTLRESIPPMLFYWNDSIGEIGGPGAVDELGPGTFGPRPGKGIAIGGDLMSSLPSDMRAENLMCYIGHEGTYTPSHREMCGSLGHNIMVEASENYDEAGRPTKPGSSIWFMTETKDRETVAEYWQSILGHDIETEDHFAQIAAWQKAPFAVYVLEQSVGDFLLIPPLAPHQVWNRGTRTMKVAWNRTTVETLEIAFREALPKARMVCRDEQYKNKAIVYYTLLKYSNLLKVAAVQAQRGGPAAWDQIYRSRRVRQVQKDFTRLFGMFKEIMLSEMFTEGTRGHPEYLAYDSNVTCSYCRGNIFNRFLSCESCADIVTPGVDEPYDVCMDCYVMGRSCRCRSKYKWVEQFKWKDLVAHYEEWRAQVASILQNHPNAADRIPLSLPEERKRYKKIPLAEICQNQLKLRPWVDVRNPKPLPTEEELEAEEDVEVDDEGFAKTKRRHTKDWHQNQKSCHVCLKRHPKWMMAHCTMCERSWCFGSLWRAHEIQPQHVLEDPLWDCPHCRKVCSTGACRKDPRMKPYEPKQTLLGHDTKKVADVRSTEVLVDFSVSNKSWLQDDINDPNGKRIQKKKETAERAKQNDMIYLPEEHYVNDHEDEGIEMSPEDGPQIEYDPVDPFIDPALVSPDTLVGSANSFSAIFDGEASMNEPAYAGTARSHQFAAVNSQSLYPDFEDEGDQSGLFVTPSELLLQPEGMGFADDADPVQPTFVKRKRGDKDESSQIKFTDSKRRKLDPTEESKKKAKNVNKASKQFQEGQVHKRLEEARKEGRFVIVKGALEGLKKIVMLQIDGTKLAAIVAKAKPNRPSRQSNGPHPNATDTIAPTLLQSDLAVAQPARGGALKAANRKPNQFRVQLEDDEDYHARGNTDPDRIDKKKKKSTRKVYEDITVESDDEATTTRTPRAPRQRRNRHNDEDEDGEFPDELPEDFRDGQVRDRKRDREREAERRKTMPAALNSRPRPTAMKAPRIRPVSASIVNIRDQMDGSDDDASPVKATNAAAVAQQTTAFEEQNRLAKLEAAGILSNEIDGLLDDADVDPPSPAFASPPRINVAAPSNTAAGASTSPLNAPTAPMRPPSTSAASLKPPAPATKPKKLSPGELKRQGKSIQARIKKPSTERIEISSESSEDDSSDENEIPAKAAPVGRRPQVARRGGRRA